MPSQELFALWILPADFPGRLIPVFHLPQGGTYNVWALNPPAYVSVRVSAVQHVLPVPRGSGGWVNLGRIEAPQLGAPNSSRIQITSPRLPEALLLSDPSLGAPASLVPPTHARRLVAASSWVVPPSEDTIWPASMRLVPIAEECVASCNPAIGDLDDDGLDEFAIPFTLPDGTDGVACFRGTGETLWVNRDLAFFQRFYDAPNRYRNIHFHHRAVHRHLWAQARDVDGDGRAEVVVGIGPLYVLDGRTGGVKQVIDLRGGIHLWCFAHFDGPQKPPCLVAAVDPLQEGASGFVCALVPSEGYTERWRTEVPSRRFEDCMYAGDLDGDGRDEVAFSLSDVRQFWLMDGRGEVRWKVSVPEAIGDDTHVDDFRYLDHPVHGRCIATGTGGALIDAQGRVLWTLRETLHHGQTVQVLPGLKEGGPAFYFADSFGGFAIFASANGQELRRVPDFTRVAELRRDQIIHRLTVANDLAHWGPQGSVVVVQGEVFVARATHDVPAGEVPLRLSILSPDGRALGRLPLHDLAICRGMTGPMCVRACNATHHARETGQEDLLVVLHTSGQALVVSPLVQGE